MPTLIIELDADDVSDLDFLRFRAVDAVEEVVDTYQNNLDGEVEVSWSLED